MAEEIAAVAEEAEVAAAAKQISLSTAQSPAAM